MKPVSQPYADFTRRFSALLEEARRLPLGAAVPSQTPAPRPGAPRTVIFAPHPDDECLTGALPLRLQRELGHAVEVAAVTYGSRKDRQAPRAAELRAACGFLGWKVLDAEPAAALAAAKPALILLPHARDANGTHRKVHAQVLDALKSQGPAFRCLVAETEYWSTLEDPNLMVESSQTEAADLVAALSFHRGEVERNPYHVLLPCWLADGVRRGAELVGGQGDGSPAFAFATLYRVSRWNGASLERLPSRVLPSGADLSALFAA